VGKDENREIESQYFVLQS